MTFGVALKNRIRKIAAWMQVMDLKTEAKLSILCLLPFFIVKIQFNLAATLRYNVLVHLACLISTLERTRQTSKRILAPLVIVYNCCLVYDQFQIVASSILTYSAPEI